MKYKCTVFSYGLSRRGMDRWQQTFRNRTVAYLCTRLAAILVDYFGGVHPELGIAWEIEKETK